MSTYSKNSSPQAIALQYEAVSGNSLSGNKNAKGAPKVIAKGSGNLAQDIIALAEQHGIFIHQDEHDCFFLCAAGEIP